MGKEYTDAIDYRVDSSRVFAGNNSHSAIVLHGTGGSATQTAQQLGDYFRTNTGWTSSHFGIDRAGIVCQYVSLADGACANCCLEAGHDPFWDQFDGDNLNLHTISIEHTNDNANSLALTPAQQDASFKLVAWLCKKYNLTVDQIKTHASIAPSSRARCPGAQYPLAALKTYLQKSEMSFAPIEKACQDTWNSTAHLFGGPLACDTGIAKAWRKIYLSGHNLPGPTTREFPSVDWNGNPIVVQLFGTIRCEWMAGQAHWYHATGGIV